MGSLNKLHFFAQGVNKLHKGLFLNKYRADKTFFLNFYLSFPKWFKDVKTENI